MPEVNKIFRNGLPSEIFSSLLGRCKPFLFVDEVFLKESASTRFLFTEKKKENQIDDNY